MMEQTPQSAHEEGKAMDLAVAGTSRASRRAAWQRSWAAGLMVFGTLWAMFYVWHAGFLFAPALYEEPDIGRHLALRGGFLSPFDSSDGAPPSSWSPPVYPVLAAFSFRIFGVESPGASALLAVINAFCYGAVAAGLFALGSEVFNRTTGGVSAVLFLIHPMFLRASGKFWDAYPALAMFIWLVIGALAIRKSGVAVTRMALLGAGLGILALTNAAYLLAIPAVVIIAASRAGLKRAAGYSAAALLAFVLVMTPWTVRNYVVFGRLFFVRGGANLELWFGNLPGATGWLNSHVFGPHPGHDMHERQLLLGLGETAYFERCGQRFWEGYRQDPRAFWSRSAARVGYLFLSDPTDKAHYPFMPDWKWRGYVVSRVLTNTAVSVLALTGAWTAWRLGHSGWLLLVMGGLSVAPFAAAAVWDRHTMPLRAMLLVLAGFLLAAIWHRFRWGEWPTAVPSKPATSQDRVGRPGNAGANQSEVGR